MEFRVKMLRRVSREGGHKLPFLLLGSVDVLQHHRIVEVPERGARLCPCWAARLS